MSEKLEVSVSLDMAQLKTDLNNMKTELKKVGKDGLKIKPTIDTTDVKKGYSEIENAQKTSMTKQTANVKQYATLSEASIRNLKVYGVKQLNELSEAGKLDVARIDQETKVWANGIRKVGLVATDTGKKISEAMKEKYIELGIDKAKLQKDISAAKVEIEKGLVSRKIDLNISTEKAKLELANAKAKLKDWENQVETPDELKLNVKEAELKVSKLKTELVNLNKNSKIQLDIRTKEANKNLAYTNKQMRNIEATGKDATTRLKKHFTDLSNSIKARLGTAALLAGLGLAIRGIIRGLEEAKNVALKWESAFTGVIKTTNGTKREIAGLKQELIDLTKEIPLTFEEISKIAELGGQMGVPIKQINAFTKAVAQIAVTTDLSIEDAAKQFARLHNILQLPLDSIDKTASAVVALGNNFAAQESEILNFTTRIAGSGRVVDLAAGSLTGIATAFTSVGIKSELGGSAVSKALLKINDAVVEGGDKLEKFAKVSGLTAEEFKTTWENDSAEAFTKFVEGLGVSGDAANGIIKELLGNNVRTKQAFLNLANAGDLLRKAIKLGNDAYRENIALSKEAELRFGTEESKLKLLTNEYEEQQKVIGEKLLPGYVSLQKAKLNLLKGIVKITEAMGGFNNVLKVLIPTIIALGGVLAFAFAGPVGLAIIGAIAAITAGVTFLGSQSDKTVTSLEKLNNKLGELKKKLIENGDAQDQLRQNYIDGKISIEEYTKSLDDLLSKEKDLSNEQDEVIARLEGHKVIMEELNKVGDAREEIINRQEDALLKLNEAEIKYKKSMELALAQRENDRSKLGDTTAEENYKKSLVGIKDELQNQKDAYKSVIDSGSKMSKELDNQSEVLKVFELAGYDGAEALEAINDVTVDMDPTKAELDKINNVLDETKQTAIDTQQKLLTSAEEELAILQAKADKIEKIGRYISAIIPNATLLFKTIEKIIFSKKISEATSQVDLLKGKIKSVRDAKLDPIQPSIPLSTMTKDLERVNNTLSMMADTSDEIGNKLEAIGSLLNDDNLSSEQKNRLLIEQKDLQESLTKLKEKENATIGKSINKSETKNALMKAELELAKQQYIQAIKNTDGVYSNDVKQANALQRIKEDYEAKVKDINKNTSDSIIANAEELIEKNEELKSKGQEAFDDLGDAVQGVAEDMKSIAEEMATVNQEMDDINADAIKDMQNRYGDILTELDDINIKIAETESQINESSDSTEDLNDAWAKVNKEMEDGQKSIDDYQKSISKINESVTDLDVSSGEELADLYVSLGEEIVKNQTRLDELNAKTILTTAESEEKLKLEEETTKAIEDQAKARAEITDEQITNATVKANESDVDKIIRERDEKKAIYDQELADIQQKLSEQQQLLQDNTAIEQDLRAKLDIIEQEAQKVKLDKLQSQLEQYYAEREALIAEKAQAESELTNKQLEDATNNELQTETQLIIDKRDMDLASKQQELQDLKDSNNAKLEEMKQYQIKLIRLAELGKSQFGKSFWFTDFDKKTFDANISGTDTSSLRTGVNSAYTVDTEEQKVANDKLEIMSDKMEQFIALTKDDGDKLLKFLKVVTGLREEANIGQVLDQKTIKTIQQQNSFVVGGPLDLASIESMLRRSLKI